MDRIYDIRKTKHAEYTKGDVMGNSIKKIIAGNKHIQAFIRPFSLTKSSAISPNNKIVDAYIFDWDNNLSENNHLIATHIDLCDEKTEGALCDNTKGTQQ
jgi:hypothetical protein